MFGSNVILQVNTFQWLSHTVIYTEPPTIQAHNFDDEINLINT